MTKLHILLDKRRTMLAEVRAIEDKMEAADYAGDQVEDDAKIDQILADIEDLDKKIERAQKTEQAEARFKDRNKDTDDDDEPGTYRAAARPIDREDEAKAGFTDLADFAVAVRNRMDPRIGIFDERLNAAAHQEQGTGESFMVPASMANDIWEAVAADEFSFLELTDGEVTSKNQVTAPTDESTPWGSTGIQANWRSENTQMNESNLFTETADVKLSELYAFATATEELMEDAPLLNSRLQKGSARAIAWKIGEGIMRGDGVGKFEGFLSSSALVTVAKESGQAADSIVAANVLKMYSRMLDASKGRALWLANSDTLPQLATMTIGDQPVYQPPSNLMGAQGGTLLGRPLRFTEHADTVGDVGDLSFVDFMGYYTIRKASGVKFASSLHLYFDYNKMAFRWVVRLGGQPKLSAPVTPPYSSNTKSHFVALAERA